MGSDGHDSMRTKSILDLLFLIRCLSTKYLRGEIKLSENFRVADKSKTCTGFDHLGNLSWYFGDDDGGDADDISDGGDIDGDGGGGGDEE